MALDLGRYCDHRRQLTDSAAATITDANDFALDLDRCSERKSALVLDP